MLTKYTIHMYNLGYLNEKGTLNLKRFQKFMETLANFDYDQFRDTYADIKYLEGKRMPDTTNIKVNTTKKSILFTPNNLYYIFENGKLIFKNIFLG